MLENNLILVNDRILKMNLKLDTTSTFSFCPYKFRENVFYLRHVNLSKRKLLSTVYISSMWHRRMLYSCLIFVFVFPCILDDTRLISLIQGTLFIHKTIHVCFSYFCLVWIKYARALHCSMKCICSFFKLIWKHFFFIIPNIKFHNSLTLS